MRTYTGDNHYLSISCSARGEERFLTIYQGGAVMSVLRYYKGKKEEEFILPVPEGSEIETDDPIKLLGKRPDRKKAPFAFHYAPEKGWLNDPNGLILHDGVYHMYYQHNPLSREWGNMSWGHAVSDDLVSWREEDPVLLPEDKDHVSFSGSAYEEDGRIAVYYTLWDIDDKEDNLVLRKESADGYDFAGRKEFLPRVGKEARDPKVFEWEGDKYLLIYLEGNDFGLCKEKDGGWELTDRFSAAPGWECPNIVMTGDKLYFLAAGGSYWEARIVDDRMILEGTRKELFLNSLPYASHVFSGTPGRQVLIPWLRVRTPTLPSTGCMGIPREVVDEGGTLSLVPVMEVLESLRLRPFVRKDNVVTDERTAFIFFQEAESFSGTVNGNPVSYDKDTGRLRVNDDEVTISSSELVLMIDSLVLEVSAKGYTENAYFELDEGKGTALTSPSPMSGAIGLLRTVRQSLR